MAKLSARGQTVVYKIFKPLTEEQAFNQERPVKKILMSSGKVLVNYGTGWKLAGKLKNLATPEEWLKQKEAAGWRLDQ
jgi:hypothetical protein